MTYSGCNLTKTKGYIMAETELIRFYDTNALLNLQGEAFSTPFIISQKTLEELEHIKTSNSKDKEIKYKARRIVKLLDQNEEKYQVIFYNQEIYHLLSNYELSDTPDNIIAASALWINDNVQPVLFITDDINCKIIARDIFKLNVQSLRDQEEAIYKGYRVLKGSTEEINDIMSSYTKDDWNANEYLIIQNTDDGTTKEMRFDGNNFVGLKLPPSRFIKAKNSLQRCALDMLMNPDITIAAILGGYGSGKSYLTMRMALFNVTEKGMQSKILGVREPHGEGKEVGYLPGTLDDKTDNFFLPLVQQLDKGEYEFDRLKQQGILESIIPYYMKGTTYNDTILLVDEAEDLSEKQIRLVGTRLGEKSRIFFSGDYKQSVVNNTEQNALVKMCNELKGNPLFGCIYLGEDVRSNTSKVFANLFK